MKGRIATQEERDEALILAVAMIVDREPKDSRLVSAEAVALASVLCDCATRETMQVIREAINKLERVEK